MGLFNEFLNNLEIICLGRVGLSVFWTVFGGVLSFQLGFHLNGLDFVACLLVKQF